MQHSKAGGGSGSQPSDTPARRPLTKVAVIQAASAAFDTRRSMRKLADWLTRAAAQGAQLAVFPEAFIGGYPKGMTFGVVVGERTPEGREWFRRYYEAAIAVPGEECGTIANLCRKHNIHCVVGVIEKDGGTLYCTALFFSPEAGLMGKHRKLMPTAAERLIWGFGDGSTLPMLETSIGKISAAICWENYMPLVRTALYAKGVQLYTVPTVDARERWAASMQHIAVEGRCFVLSACQFTRRSDYPTDCPMTISGNNLNSDAVVIGGGSCIVDPHGQIIAGPLRDREDILIAEIDLEECIRAKFDFDVVGHYARPDVFQLRVNETEQRSVVLPKALL